MGKHRTAGLSLTILVTTSVVLAVSCVPPPRSGGGTTTTRPATTTTVIATTTSQFGISTTTSTPATTQNTTTTTSPYTTTTEHAPNTTIPGPGGALATVLSIATGAAHACALLSDHTVTCWGDNSRGQLGNGTTVSSATPVANGLFNVQQLVAGDYFTCALHTAGDVVCWGSNDYGQLGRSSFDTTPQQLPGTVDGLFLAHAITAGANHACALENTGATACWGRNDMGQLGHGTISAFESTPVSVILPPPVFVTTTEFNQIAAGGDHTCATATVGDMYCWGANGHGQLGNGSTASSTIPTAVGSGFYTGQFTTGAEFTCAKDGFTSALDCWGRNTEGELGIGSTTDWSIPTATSIGSGPVLTAGGTTACLTGPIRCWGDNRFGQLGRGSTTLTQATTAATVGGLPADPVALAGGGQFMCALEPDTTVWCWGSNDHGQLGAGATSSLSATPLPVTY